jgi:hypothetical protein
MGPVIAVLPAACGSLQSIAACFRNIRLGTAFTRADVDRALLLVPSVTDCSISVEHSQRKPCAILPITGVMLPYAWHCGRWMSYWRTVIKLDALHLDRT